MGNRFKQTFLQRRPTNCQKVYTKVLNITDHRSHANQHHNKISPHPTNNANVIKMTGAGEDVEKREKQTLLVGM
jgi:hypothetical protein